MPSRGGNSNGGLLDGLRGCLKFWRSFLVIIVPLAALPILSVAEGENEKVTKSIKTFQRQREVGLILFYAFAGFQVRVRHGDHGLVLGDGGSAPRHHLPHPRGAASRSRYVRDVKSNLLSIILNSVVLYIYYVIGIMTTDAVGKEYLKETNMMFISGIMMAIAVEHCNLHKRIALNVMMLIGTSPRR